MTYKWQFTGMEVQTPRALRRRAALPRTREAKIEAVRCHSHPKVPIGEAHGCQYDSPGEGTDSKPGPG